MPASAFDLRAGASLRRWVEPRLLEPDSIAHIARGVSGGSNPRWLVLDDVFDPEFLDELARRHRHLRYRRSGALTPFDSHYVFAREDVHFGTDLWLSREWQALVSALIGVELSAPDRAELRFYRQRPRANGLWIHSDHTAKKPTRVGMIVYLSRQWSRDDGGVLQFWDHLGPAPSDDPGLHRWWANVGGRLDFLAAQNELSIECGDFNGYRTAQRMRKVGEVVPQFGRMVLIDFTNGPSHHSVTPSTANRARYNITEWMQ